MAEYYVQMKKINYSYIISTILFIGVFSATNLSYAQTWTETQNQIKDNTQQIKNIEEKIFDLKDNYRLLYDGAKNQNDQLGNQISFAGYLLAGFSFVFTILGLFLGLYINRQSKKVTEMKEIVMATKKVIDGHSADLYKKLKREETLNLLFRLQEVPDDITNICPLLLSRDLLEADYVSLRTPYLKIKSLIPLNRDAKNNYMVLLLQHFPYEALKDSEIKEDITKSINLTHIEIMFNRDIKNFFYQILRYLKEFNIDSEENKTIIQNLFYFCSKSKFKDSTELQNYIKDNLSKNDMRTASIASILKEKHLKDTVYTTWIDSIFN
jgi:hypothetical protein